DRASATVGVVSTSRCGTSALRGGSSLLRLDHDAFPQAHTRGLARPGPALSRCTKARRTPTRATLDRTGRRRLVRQSRLSGRDLPFGVGVHETTFRVNVRWVTPLGAETASTS